MLKNALLVSLLSGCFCLQQAMAEEVPPPSVSEQEPRTVLGAVSALVAGRLGAYEHGRSASDCWRSCCF